MKRLTILLAAMFAFATFAAAQTQFGLEAGVGIKKMSFSKDVYKSDNFAGFFVGPKVKAKIPVVGLGVDGALLYALDKAKIDDSKTKHMSYVRLPLNLRWDIGTSFFGVYAATGPQWEWLIGNSDLTTREGLHATFEHHVFNWNVGAGIMFANHIEIGASYSIPIGKAGSVSGVYDTVKDNISIKNKEWQIRLNYYF